MPKSSKPVQQSSTLLVPEVHEVPQHVAVIMDGNGRWATARHLPRMAGHERGVAALRGVVEGCARRGVKALTVFAFSSENWRRPEEEVSFLMNLFLLALEREVKSLKSNGVQLRIIGDLSAFSFKLQKAIERAQLATRDNTGLCLTVAVNYGGRWDMLRAVRKMLDENPALAAAGQPIGEEQLTPHLCLADLPEPDLFIRTGGETRVSNFMLWQLAYTELYFTDTLWPDFDDAALEAAFVSYRQRERRFGRTSEQVVTARTCD